MNLWENLWHTASGDMSFFGYEHFDDPIEAAETGQSEGKRSHN